MLLLLQVGYTPLKVTGDVDHEDLVLSLEYVNCYAPLWLLLCSGGWFTLAFGQVYGRV